MSNTLSITKDQLVGDRLADLREEYARQNLDTTSLRDLSSRLYGHTSPDDVGNAVRKLLDYNCRILLERLEPRYRADTLAEVISRLSEHMEQTDAWKTFMHYAKFLKYFGNQAVHRNDVHLDQIDQDMMMAGICKLSKLLLMLMSSSMHRKSSTSSFVSVDPPERIVSVEPPKRIVSVNPFPSTAYFHQDPTRKSSTPATGLISTATPPSSRVFISSPPVNPTTTLWVGNIPTEINKMDLLQLLGNPSNVICTIKRGEWNKEGILYNYAFIEFINIASSTAARQRLIELGYEVRFRESRTYLPSGLKNRHYGHSE